MRKSMRNRLANKIILLRQPFKNFLSNRILFFSAALSCLSVLAIEGIIYKYRSIIGKVREFYSYLSLKDELYPSIVLFILALGTMLYFLRRIVKPSATVSQKIPHMGFHNLTLFEDGGSADVGRN